MRNALSDSLINKKDEEWVAGLAFFPDAKMLAIANWESVIRVVDTATGEEIRRFGSVETPTHELLISSLCFSPDGRKLASGHTDTTITIWVLLPAF